MLLQFYLMIHYQPPAPEFHGSESITIENIVNYSRSLSTFRSLKLIIVANLDHKIEYIVIIIDYFG